MRSRVAHHAHLCALLPAVAAYAVFIGSVSIGALGGAAIAAFGPGWAFFVNGISYGAVLTGLALMRFEAVPPQQP